MSVSSITLIDSGLVIDITAPNQSADQEVLFNKSPKKIRGVKMSGRLYIKNFKTCTRCSSSIITGNPSSVDPAWNSAHLFDALKSEEQSFRNMHSVPLNEKLNISWAVPMEDEVVQGEGRCEFCHSLCEKKRTIVSMVVIL